MGYFRNQVGRPVVETKNSPPPQQPTPAKSGQQAHFAPQVGKPSASQSATAVDRGPRCNGELAEDDGYARGGGRCGGRWVAGGPGRWLDPAALPFGACSCCRPRLALVAADVGAICPASRTEYLILPEGVTERATA